MRKHRLSSLVLFCLLLLALMGCETPRSARLTPPMPGQPIIRVRVQEQAGQVTLTGPREVRITRDDRSHRTYQLPTPVTLRLPGGKWSVTGGAPTDLDRAPLRIRSIDSTPIRLGDRAYPGEIQLEPIRAESSNSPLDRFDVVNYVPLESYLPGVLEKELYPNWRQATFQAQAIAARSYAIERMIAFGENHHYDVESTHASQVYGGYSTHSTALQATKETTGLVLTYHGKIIPAFFSSTCGGVSDSPMNAFGGATIEPLNPQPHAPWCSISPHYHWKPIKRNRMSLSQRIATWGKAHHHQVAQLGTITGIQVTAYSELGRPTRFALTDHQGRSFILSSGSFRTACNFDSPQFNLPPLPREVVLKSSFCDVSVDRDDVIFHSGRGFGHGVGLCQFGAEGMARAGLDAMTILKTYYPGAVVQRAY